MDTIKLYHYSDQDIKGKIDPKFFGKHSFTQTSANLSNIKRSYFYTNTTEKEFFFDQAKFCYTVRVNKKLLYDLKKDPLELWGELSDDQDFYDIVPIIKKKGYIGIIGTNGFKVVCLFKAIKFINRRLL